MSYFEELNSPMLRPEDKMIKSLWEYRRLLARILIQNFSARLLKDEHWSTFRESCEQPVRSSALHEAVGHGRLESNCR